MVFGSSSNNPTHEPRNISLSIWNQEQINQELPGEGTAKNPCNWSESSQKNKG